MAISPVREFVNGLFEDSERLGRCSHIRRDRTGPYCGKNLHGRQVSEERRNVCNLDSLQSWCLGRSYQDCVYFKGKETLE